MPTLILKLATIEAHHPIVAEPVPKSTAEKNCLEDLAITDHIAVVALREERSLCPARTGHGRCRGPSKYRP
jgi:hypothetical protein